MSFVVDTVKSVFGGTTSAEKAAQRSADVQERTTELGIEEQRRQFDVTTEGLERARRLQRDELRRGERKADSFAVKYGYGDEMITALEKIHAWIDKVRAKRPCGKMCKAIIKFSETTDEHPPLKKTVEDIMKSKETWEKTKRFNFVKMRGFITNKLKG